MRCCLLLIGLFLCTIAIQAQYDLMYSVNKEGKIIALPKPGSYEIKIPETSFYSYTPASTQKIDFKLQDFMPEFQPLPDERPMNMHVLSNAYRPFFNVYAPMLKRVSPMAFDFVEASVVPINEDFTFVTVGSQYTLPGAGGVTTINPMLSWNLDDLTITGGAFVGRYFTPFNPSPGFVGGANLQLKYDVTDWMAVRAWGQYAYYWSGDKNRSQFNELYNPHMLMNPFYNHTAVGGAFEFKINENVGIGVGVNYEYNPWRKKMDTQYLVYPVIRSGKFKIGVW